MVPDDAAVTALEVLANADLKLEWAERHIAEFEEEIRRFHARESYTTTEGEEGPQGRLVRLSDPPTTPPQIGLIASDALHNMRAALDYLACALAVANGKTMDGVHFPIASSVEKFEEKPIQKHVRKLSAEAKTFIAGLQPYKGGENRLWALHELDKVDKHRNLIPLNIASLMIYYTPRPVEDDGLTIPRETTPLYDYKVTPVPGFDRLAGFEGQSTLTLLKEFSSCVADVLRRARSEFFPGTERARVFGDGSI